MSRREGTRQRAYTGMHVERGKTVSVVQFNSVAKGAKAGRSLFERLAECAEATGDPRHMHLPHMLTVCLRFAIRAARQGAAGADRRPLGGGGDVTGRTVGGW